MWDELTTTLMETVKIVSIVTLLMVIIEYLELRFKDRISEKITQKPATQYVAASLLGVIPGCIDAFFIVSLYVHGIVGFGALAAVMLSTAGDEAFVMLAMLPKESLFIFLFCALMGIIGGFAADEVAKLFKIRTCQPCAIETHNEESDVRHFLREHIFGHILKKHIPRLFLWIFLTMLAADLLVKNVGLASVISSLPKLYLILFAALIGIIPESGPHLLFLMLYSRGLIPFSVLLVNTLSQDGHGLLPLLSYSFKDTVYLQIFTTLFSLIVGVVLFLMGV